MLFRCIIKMKLSIILCLVSFTILFLSEKYAKNALILPKRIRVFFGSKLDTSLTQDYNQNKLENSLLTILGFQCNIDT